MKVFIADDSNIVRARLLMTLGDIKGIEIVGQAQDGYSALQKIRTLKPDVVILDIQMPGVDGIQVLKQIKQHQPDTTVIMLTNYPYLVVKIKCLSAGADHFFDKSTEVDALYKVIQKLAKGGQVTNE